MPVQLLMIALMRAAAVGLQLQGQASAATALTRLALAYEAGRSIDAHMGEIAKLLNEGGEMASWEDITARIDAAEKEFLS
jgi:hypothetical protein